MAPGADEPDDRTAFPIPATGYARFALPEALGNGPTAAVVAVHGYGQDPREMLAFAQGVAGPDVVVVAPEGPQAFYREVPQPGGATRREVGYGWIADPRREDAEQRNDALISAALDAAGARAPLDPARTVFLGYSQGVGVAARWLVRNPGRARALVGLAGGVPVPARPLLALLRGLDLLWVTGERDRAYPPAYEEELLASMRSSGLAVESVVLPTGHGLLDLAAGVLKPWIAERTRAPFLPGPPPRR